MQNLYYSLKNATDLALGSTDDASFARDALPLRLLASGNDLGLCVSFERLGHCVYNLTRNQSVSVRLQAVRVRDETYQTGDDQRIRNEVEIVRLVVEEEQPKEKREEIGCHER